MLLIGGDIASHPISLTITGLCGSMNAVLLLLAFVPPHAYLRWIGGDALEAA